MVFRFNPEKDKMAFGNVFIYNKSVNLFYKEKNLMAKALIICAAGMSSSLMAKKTTEFLKNKGEDIEVDAISATEGGKAIAAADFDLYLISPQTKMYYKQFEEAAAKVGKPIAQIPPQAYIPIPMGIEKMASLIKENIG
ncbi:PTS system, cellobiose-specific IIB component [Streptococcus sp. DD11]|nr:PTS system, cellobiose-specific IIB component [Streptococcus sp. DD11]